MRTNRLKALLDNSRASSKHKGGSGTFFASSEMCSLVTTESEIAAFGWNQILSASEKDEMNRRLILSVVFSYFDLYP